MSDSERPEKVAFGELDQLIGQLSEELTAVRHRAVQAEAKLRELESGTPITADRVAALQRENSGLRKRLDQAAERTRTTMERLRFLRQQGERGGER
ncbi:MAG: hypothetical protein NVS1B4_13260 [Gemmatimonadaceae bacterium]